MLLLEKPTHTVRPTLIRAARSVWLVRRRYLLHDLQRRAGWAVQARTAPTLGSWMEFLEAEARPRRASGTLREPADRYRRR